MNRKIPRCACSFDCILQLADGTEVRSYLVDISANGGAICPENPSDIEKIPLGTVAILRVDLKSVIEIKSVFSAEVVVRWNKGTLIGAEVVQVDTENFKKWLVLLYKSYFSA